jgi:phosphatidylserine decarboxylase
MSTASPQDRLFALIQQLLPTRLLSWGMYQITRVEAAWFKNGFIRLFMRGFGIRLDEAERERPEDYRHFNDFFTRALKAGARPLAPEPAFLSPVDGTLSQFGPVQSGRLIQAKGHDYRVQDLLADPQLASEFVNGDFATIYLAPYNYHRIHMPAGARLREWRYVPGRLFSVNAATARAMPGLFARNERVIATFDTDRGPLAMVLVGALFVGSIETVWAGQISPPHRRAAWSRAERPGEPLALPRGAEMGRFNMGSTVILLTGPGMVAWDGQLDSGRTVRMGEALGVLR